MIATNFYNRNKHRAEIETILTKNKGSEAANFQTILESYNLAMTQQKIELADVQKRFTEYIQDASQERAKNKDELNKAMNMIEQIERENRSLRAKIEILTSDICSVKGISREEYFKNLEVGQDINFDNEDV